MSKYGDLRLLDFDDLIMSKMLSEGATYKDLSKALGLTPPAISHRMRKLERIIPGFSSHCRNGNRIFNPIAIEFCQTAKQVLSLLEKHHVEN
jgi:hypothetical protein